MSLLCSAGSIAIASPYSNCCSSTDRSVVLQVGEPDYDARLVAYARLTPALWAALPPWRAAPLVHAALADLRDADDIALRSAAAQVHGEGFRL